MLDGHVFYSLIIHNFAANFGNFGASKCQSEDVNPCSQAQSLIFDGLVVEATLAREMAEESKKLSSENLPTLLASHFDTNQSMPKPLCIVWILFLPWTHPPHFPMWNVEGTAFGRLTPGNNSFALASSQKKILEMTKSSPIATLQIFEVM